MELTSPPGTRKFSGVSPFGPATDCDRFDWLGLAGARVTDLRVTGMAVGLLSNVASMRFHPLTFFTVITMSPSPARLRRVKHELAGDVACS
jgi:hypothetical protein